MYSATIFSGFKNIQADQIDTLFNAYILEHGFRALFESSYKWSFVSPPFFYPLPEMLFESDNLLGTAPIYWLLRLFFDWTVSFQLWGIVQTIFTYIAMLVLLLALGINPVISALSGYVFAFGMPRIAQLSHPQIFAQFYMCFALVYLFKYLKFLRHRDFNLFMLFVTLQFVAGFYLGWFLLLSLFVGFFLYGVFATENFKKVVLEVKNNSFYYIKSVLFWGVVNGLFWVKYFINGGQYKLVTVFLHALEYLNSPASYLTATKGSLWSYAFTKPENITQENYIFPGAFFYLMIIITALFIIVPLFKPQNQTRAEFVRRFRSVYAENISKDTLGIIRTSFFTGLVLNIITTSFFGQSIWLIVALIIPGAEAIRYAARIWVVSHIWFYIAGGLTLTYLLEKSPHINYKKFVIPLVIFAVVEQFVVRPVYIDKTKFLTAVTKASDSLSSAVHCDFAYFRSKEMPLEVDGAPNGYLRGSKNIEAMWTSLYSGIPTINGYTAWLKYKFDKLYTPEDLTELTKRPGETACVYDEDGLQETWILPEIKQ
ncbi:hypothetical protein GYA27_00050 [candidate division WWE3 bacterium]|uniref:Glycosyltransferase RgtA/B/C/D-like domain-containing protein n=1 Tax=candidate division WWE3 bacterium TaxID=2053526 RepID=A0A7X9DJT2_UNCKA|nr:hypothetical protein [candidate division WWE3 bacterium]